MKVIEKYKNGYNLRQTKDGKYHVYFGAIWQDTYKDLEQCKQNPNIKNQKKLITNKTN